MDSEAIKLARGIFPYLKKGIIYFNHAGNGPLTTRHLQTVKNLLFENSEGSIDVYEEMLMVANDSKKILAKMLNTSSERIAFINNTSSGLNVLAQGIQWENDDRIILNDVEFPANVYPFMNLQTKGVKIDFVKSNNGIVTAENIIAAIKPQTKLVSVSFVQFLSGYRIDLEKLGKVCRDRKIILCVDAIQALGALMLDVQKSNIDFISCGTQKWLLGLQGMAFIYINEGLQNKINTVPIGWLSVENAWNFTDYDMTLGKTANRYQAGTLNTYGVYALNTSLKIFNEFGFEKIENQILSNSEYMMEKLINSGIEPMLKDMKRKTLSGIVSIKRNDSDDILKYLQKSKIVCAVRQGILRFSPHFYNTEDEIDKVVAELEKYSNINQQ